MDRAQVRKILIGAALAVGGAILTYGLNTVVPILHDQDGMWGPAVAATLAILLNAARKWIESQSKGGEQSDG